MSPSGVGVRASARGFVQQSPHPIPVRSTNRMPFKARRSSTRGRPPWAERGGASGSNGSNFSHSAALTSLSFISLQRFRQRWRRLCFVSRSNPDRPDRPHRIAWARLLKRVFDIDMQHCPNCGAGELKIIAAILERPVIEKILTHLGLDPQPPPRGRAREARQD